MKMAARSDKLARVEQVDKMTTLVMVKKLWQKSRKIGYEQFAASFQMEADFFLEIPKENNVG